MYTIKTKARRNSRTYGKIVAAIPDIAGVRAFLAANDLYVTNRPYFFTHLGLSDGSIIVQTVSVGGKELTCSPTKLAEALSV